MSDYQDAYLKNVQATFRYFAYHTNNPSKERLSWIPSNFHKFLCDTVQEFLERENRTPIEILILNTPPQHGKSKTITETLPAWYLLRHPDDSVIEVSYGDDLAERFGKSNLEKVREFGALFGIAPDKNKSTAKEFQIANHKGRMISRGIGSALTGYSGDLIVIDDPVKNRQEADSESRREFIWNEFINSIMSRSQAKTKIILIMTRWHEDDLAGRIMEEFQDITTVVNLPCEAEEDDPLGRQVGEALCPEIGKGDEWLKDFKKTYTGENGVRAWNALYQGRPTALEGNLLKREWWEYYERSAVDNGQLKFEKMIMSVDATFKDEKKNDYVAISVWGKTRVRLYLVDMVNEHLNLTATIRKIKVLKAKYPKISQIYIEDKANGSAIIQMLRDQIRGVVAVVPDVSKEARVNAVSFVIEAGNVYLPRDKKITWEFIDQCASFPNGKHDDMVDSMSMALSKLIFSRSYTRRMEKLHGAKPSFTLPKPKKSDSRAYGRGEAIHVI